VKEISQQIKDQAILGHECLTYLGREPGLAGTAALSVAGVTTLALCLEGAASTGTGVDLRRFADDEAVLHELADVLSAVCHGDSIDFIE